jgi:hypothetical protein
VLHEAAVALGAMLYDFQLSIANVDREVEQQLSSRLPATGRSASSGCGSG